MFLLKTDIVIAKLKNWEQASSLTTDIDAFSMMESFYVRGGGGGAFMLMHETRMDENYDLKWCQTWPLFFLFYRGKSEDQEEKPSSFSLLFLSFFLLSPKKKKKRE